ncbi:flagellar hook-length control protein FliK [Salipiger mangrovisoli]|uniref:Flagellar hook-length control protein FliK n=1 Tax=Salipiger mangrovisoli TaxID=2865933 RepID=A0ABR9WX86_9RHOB|nr:flagellar hook-length control protein FliK [Salipiger mangrovisoli]MBE9635896.1 flagellar hook-length control protein FliK [Salipiger mangrovisoli]
MQEFDTSRKEVGQRDNGAIAAHASARRARIASAASGPNVEDTRGQAALPGTAARQDAAIHESFVQAAPASEIPVRETPVRDGAVPELIARKASAQEANPRATVAGSFAPRTASVVGDVDTGQRAASAPRDEDRVFTETRGDVHLTNTRMDLAPQKDSPVPPRMAQLSPIRQVAEAIIAADGGQVDLRLEPEELGRVRFHIQLSDQGVVLHVSAERPETLEMMRRHVDQLARHLADAGLQGGSFSFSGERRSRPFTSVPRAGAPDSTAAARPAHAEAERPLPRPGSSQGLDLRL